jgi:hypothetical protein
MLKPLNHVAYKVWESKIYTNEIKLGNFLTINLPRTTEMAAKPTVASMDYDREGILSSPRISTVSSPQNSTVSPFNNDGWPVGEPLPASRDEWKKHAIHHKLVGGSIFNLDKFVSASKIGYKQFPKVRSQKLD